MAVKKIGTAQIDLRANVASLSSDMREAQNTVAKSSRAMKEELRVQTKEGSEAFRLLGEAIGIPVPRALARIAAESKAIGPILASAFSGAVLIGFLDLGMKVVEHFQKIKEKADEAGAKQYEALHKQAEAAEKLGEELHKIADENERIGKTGAALTKLTRDQVRADLTGDQKKLADAGTAIARFWIAQAEQKRGMSAAAAERYANGLSAEDAGVQRGVYRSEGYKEDESKLSKTDREKLAPLTKSFAELTREVSTGQGKLDGFNKKLGIDLTERARTATEHLDAMKESVEQVDIELASGFGDGPELVKAKGKARLGAFDRHLDEMRKQRDEDRRSGMNVGGENAAIEDYASKRPLLVAHIRFEVDEAKLKQAMAMAKDVIEHDAQNLARLPISGKDMEKALLAPTEKAKQLLDELNAKREAGRAAEQDIAAKMEDAGYSQLAIKEKLVSMDHAEGAVLQPIIDRLKALAASGAIVDPKVLAEIDKADSGVKKLGETSGEFGKVLRQDFHDGFENAFVGIVSGSESASEAFSRMAESIIADIGRMIFETLIWNSVSGFLGGLPGIGPLFKTKTGSGKALGGPVDAGTAYPVGEMGPEIFVPSTSGTIIPNSALGGSVHYHIDARGADPSVEPRLRKMLDEVTRNAATLAVGTMQQMQQRR